jgi:sortase A
MTSGDIRNRLPLSAERLLLAVGVAFLVAVAAALVHRWVFSHLALVEFDQAETALKQKDSQPSIEAKGDEGIDFGLWSEKRVRAYRESLLIKKDQPVGVLRLDRLRIRVPVFEGTDNLVLNRGVGWIAGTARPGAAGNANIGIAGHRDGFFRAFKDIALGDAVELATPGVVSFYAVDSVEIVNPDNVGVLKPRGVPSLTLVTCYPFYFFGGAPRRFIVHATLKRQGEVKKLQNTVSASTRTGQFDTEEKEDD